jgi:hypothetical protein
MRTRLSSLLAVVFLLTPLPALAAPKRAEVEPHASVIDAVLERLGGTISRLFGADEEDKGPTVDPSGLAAELPRPPSESEVPRSRSRR